MPQPPAANSSVVRHDVAAVFLSNLFFEISAYLGYTLDIAGTYLEDIEALIALWTEQGFIEVYTDNADRQYGRAKDSNSVPNSSPWYIGVYHARLLRTGENDPLVVIVFEKRDENGEEITVASLRFMLDHDDMFGAQGRTKFNLKAMKDIRMRIDSFIQRGHQA